jgi:hypothetical protein
MVSIPFIYPGPGFPQGGKISNQAVWAMVRERVAPCGERAGRHLTSARRILER